MRSGIVFIAIKPHISEPVKSVDDSACWVEFQEATGPYVCD